jgi:ribosome biogenesis GTPase A
MAKTRRMMKEMLPQVDAVIELLDARIPYSSHNPELYRITGSKPILTLFTKSALADPASTARWKKRYDAEGRRCLIVDSVSGAGLSAIPEEIRRLLADRIARYEEKGMSGRALRVMIVGIPNVGKSSLINRLAGGKRAKVEDRPGVTRDKQWIVTPGGLELLDTPGVLWPKFSDEQAAVNLALIGSINDSVLNTEELAVKLIAYLDAVYPAALMERYDLKEEAVEERLTAMEEVPLGVDRRALAVFGLIARNRCALKKGGEPDYERTSKRMLTDLRSGRLGRITLETKVIY